MPAGISRYIYRHWHGRHGLARSFWINWLLVGAGVQLIVHLADQLMPWSGSLILMALAVILAWFLICATMLWGVVGIWRSAVRRNIATGQWLWPFAAPLPPILLLAIYVFAFAQTGWRQIDGLWRTATAPPAIGAHSMALLAGGTAVEYSGGIDSGAVEDLRYFLDTHPLVRTIYLDSPGGIVDEAHGLHDLIHARGLDTAVTRSCVSACTVVFLGGSRRTVFAGGKIGFHRPWAASLLHEDIGKEVETAKREMIEAGVEAWFADRAYATPFTSVWWPTPAELRQAHVVTE